MIQSAQPGELPKIPLGQLVGYVVLLLLAPIGIWLILWLNDFRFSTWSYLLLALLPVLSFGYALVSRWRLRRMYRDGRRPAVLPASTLRIRMYLVIFTVVFVGGTAMQISER